MKALRFLRWGAVTLACCGLLIPRGRTLAADAGERVGTARIMQSAAPRSNGVASEAGGRISPLHISAAQRTLARVVRGQAPEVIDVALTAGGTLTGLVMDTEGFAVAGIGVALYQNGQALVSTVSNENGNFGITNMSGGVYQIVAGDGQGVYRFWAPQTAPPGAQTQSVVVTSAPTGPAELPAELPEESCEECKEKKGLGVDVFTLAILGVSIAALVIALDDDDDHPPKPHSP